MSEQLSYEELDRPESLTLTVAEWGCVFEMLCLYGEMVDVINGKSKYAFHMKDILAKMRKQIEGATNENLSSQSH